MPNKVKLGFLGCGFMGQLAHMDNYAKLGDCEIVALTDNKRNQAELVAARYAIPTVYTDYCEMLADPAIDAIVAAQPFTNHTNVVEDVLRAGKHLLTEKPLCVYADNGRALVESAAETGKIHMVGYHKRSDPAIEYALGVIRGWKASGEMGKMTYVRIVMPPGDWIGGAGGAIFTDEAAEPFREEPRPDGIDEKTHREYVSFVNYYIHQVNMLRYLFGEDYKLTFADRSGVLLAVESERGVTGVIEMATFLTSDDWQEEALVCFEKGWVKVELPAPLASQQAGRVNVFTDNTKSGGVLTCPRMPNRSAMRNQAMNFVKAVSGAGKPPCESREALKDLQIAMDYIQYMKRYA